MTTTYFKNVIMGNVFRTRTTPSLPAAYYIGLSRTAPNVGGGNVTEPSTTGTGYARVRLDSNNMSLPESGIIKNKVPVSFPEAQADWFPSATPATHYVIYDSATGGNLLMYNKLASNRIIEANTVATIRTNSLNLQLTD